MRPSPGQIDWTLRLGAPLLTLVVGLACIDVKLVGSWEDDLIYLCTARSLLQGEGWRVAALPGQPRVSKYPPIYPLLLTAAMACGADERSDWGLWLLHAMTVALYAGAVGLTANGWMPRLGLGVRWRCGAAAMLALNLPTQRFAASLMSEALYAWVLVGLVCAVQRAPVRAWAVGLLSLAGNLTRSVHLLLLPALGATLLRRGPRSAAAAALLALALSVAVTDSVQRYTDARNATELSPLSRQRLDYYLSYRSPVDYYLRHSGSPLRVAGTNAPAGLRAMKELFFPRQTAFANASGDQASEALRAAETLCGALLLTGAAAGLALRQQTRWVAGLLLLNAAAFTFWPWPFGVRFWTPMLPLLLVGLLLLAQRMGRSGVLLARVLGLGSLSVQAVMLGAMFGAAAPSDATFEGMELSARWLREQGGNGRGDVLLGGAGTMALAQEMEMRGQWLAAALPRGGFYDALLGFDDRLPSAKELAEEVWLMVADLRAAMPRGARLYLQAGLTTGALQHALLRRWAEQGRVVEVGPQVESRWRLYELAP